AGENTEIAALQKEMQDVDALYAKELALAGLTTQKKKELADQELAFNDQISLKIQEAQEKAAQASQKAWDSAFKQIDSAFDSQVDGLLRGTTSFQQAFRNMLASLTEDVAKFAINWTLEQGEAVAKNIALGAAEAQAHVAANALKTTSDQAASAAGALAWVGQAMKTLGADAAQVFGSVFAFMAPTMGPAAAGPAAAASASVMGGMGAIASADIGMWSVPQDMLSLVHRNELIMPAAQAGAFRDMLGAGGGAGGAAGEMHFHYAPSVQALDASGVRAVLQAHGRLFAKELAKQWSNSSQSLRPTY